MKDTLKILCILDKTTNLSFYKNILKIQGHKVISANDTNTGYNCFKEHIYREAPFDIVFISYHLQDIDGIQIAVILKKLDPLAMVMLILPSIQLNDKENIPPGFILEPGVHESSVWKVIELAQERKTGQHTTIQIKNKTTLQYSSGCFARQLKKVRAYCGYKTQSLLAEKLNVSRQVYNLWELGKRNPGYKQLALLSNILQISPCYFFIPEAAPEDYTVSQLHGKKC